MRKNDIMIAQIAQLGGKPDLLACADFRFRIDDAEREAVR